VRKRLIQFEEFLIQLAKFIASLAFIKMIAMHFCIAKAFQNFQVLYTKGLKINEAQYSES